MKCRLLLSCDNSLYHSKGKYYFKNQEWHDFYQRYLRVFDSIKIANRVCDEEILPDCRIPVDSDRIEVVHIPHFSGLKEYAGQYIRIGWMLRDVTSGCDAALVRLPSTIGQRVCKSVIKNKLPYAVEVVYDAEDGWKSSSTFIGKMLWKKIDHDMRKTCYNADGVSCVTAHYLQRHYYSKKANAFSSHYSTLALDKSFFTCERKFHNGVFTIVNVANQVVFDGRKGFKEIIEAIALLKKKNHIVNAKFAGENYHNGAKQLREYAEDLGIGEQIELVGYLNRNELSNLLDNSDLFVMPTKAEGLPRVIIEAMAKGLPVITTPVSGNPELVSSHFLVDYYDVNTLAERIRELSTNAMLYESTSSDNFKNSQEYEASILEQRRDQFYKKLYSAVVGDIFQSQEDL